MYKACPNYLCKFVLIFDMGVFMLKASSFITWGGGVYLVGKKIKSKNQTSDLKACMQ